MATLILTAVGTAVGGPLGGAIGALIGQQVDHAIFAPKTRHGPRLGELAVQTSSYGTAIPKIFGTMRAAGTVIWATELQEHRSTSGGGKGRPKTVQYSYSASFAVALSGRPIRGVRRIWADGKLLRGAAGDFKSETGFRLYLGGEDQQGDPLIAAVEGVGQAPAFRGLAYALFEDFQLADYGNRIPLLSFEIVAEEEPLTAGAVAEALSEGEVRDGGTPSMIGYAASGDSVRGAIEALGDLAPLSLTEDAGVLKLRVGAGGVVAIGADEAGAKGGGIGGRTEIQRRAAGAVPGEVAISYYDLARDYQTGLQRALRSTGSQRADRRALPAVLSASEAKGAAERRLACLWAGRASARVNLGWRRADVIPGTHLRMEGQAGLWKAERRTIEGMVTRLELLGVPAGTALPMEASPGRPVPQPDLVHGPTTVLLMDLPLGGEALPARPQLLAAAAGVEAGWRGAALTASFDGGASWQDAGLTALPAVMGTAVNALPPAGSALIDLRGSLEVQLLSDASWLESRDDAALAGGANLAAIGNELIQFGGVEPLGGGRFRLSRLLRGRRGTEWAAASHGPGEPFVLIEADVLAPIEPPLAALGGEARLIASGIGDGPEGASASCTLSGEALRPPSPVHLRAERLADGDIAISWVRRSKSGWAWLSGSDTPLGEEREAYRLTVSGAGLTRTVTLYEPADVYGAGEQETDGAAGPLTIEVVQLGTYAASRAASFLLGE